MGCTGTANQQEHSMIQRYDAGCQTEIFGTPEYPLGARTKEGDVAPCGRPPDTFGARPGAGAAVI